MKAVRLHEAGPPEVLRLEDVPVPEPRAGEVLVRLRAAALNRRDVGIRLGRQLAEARPFTPGSDGAGEIAALGPGVAGLRVGEPVLINPTLSDDTCAFCQAGEQSLCDNFRILGGPDDGTYAEYVRVPATNVRPRPAAFSWHEAAAFPLDAVTAYRLLISRGQLRAGETIAILGIGGGLATFALQLARLAGARTFVTSSSDEKLERARALGADELINYRRTPEWDEELLRRTGGRGVDVVVDTVAAGTWTRSLNAVRRGGRVLTCGATGGAEVQQNVRTIFWRQLTIVGSTMGSRSDFDAVLALAERGQLRPVIDRVFPLAEVAEAHRRLEQQAQFGKIVLDVAGGE